MGRVRRRTALIAVVAAGCRAGGDATERTARGVLVDVQASTIGRPDHITVRIADGRDLQLRVAASVEETPGHLRQHMVAGDRVRVRYSEGRQGATALGLEWEHAH